MNISFTEVNMQFLLNWVRLIPIKHAISWDDTQINKNNLLIVLLTPYHSYISIMQNRVLYAGLGTWGHLRSDAPEPTFWRANCAYCWRALALCTACRSIALLDLLVWTVPECDGCTRGISEIIHSELNLFTF